jgi:hypothetical protein
MTAITLLTLPSHLQSLVDSRVDFDASALALEDIVAVYEAKLDKQLTRMASVPEDERRMKAVVSVAKSNPKLHQAYLLANNPTRKQQRLIAEKYGLDT